MKKLIIIINCGLLPWAAAIVAAPAQGLDLSELAMALHQLDLDDQSVTIIETNGQAVLTALGSSELNGSGYQAEMSALRSAGLKARSSLAKFIHGTRVKSVQQTMEKEVSIISYETGRPEIIDSEHSRELISVIQTNSSGILKSLFTIDKWCDEKENVCHHALGTYIPE